MTVQDKPITKRLGFEVVEKSAPDSQEHFIMGYATVVEDVNGDPVVDCDGEHVPLDELRKAASRFLSEFRVGGDMHEGPAFNVLTDSLVTDLDVQKALGHNCPECGVKIERFMPVGWLVKFATNRETAAKVKKGGRLMFSIEGTARKETV